MKISAKYKVSIVMATYNGEKYLVEQLDSILSQTYPYFELIITDDGSTDNTLNIINEYQSRDSRIKVVHNMGVHGAESNFLNGFKSASGDFIAPSDQDDIWNPDKLEILLSHMTMDVDLVNAQDIILYEDNTSEPQIWYMPSISNAIWRNYLKGHTAIFRSSLVSLYEQSGMCSWDYVLELYSVITGRYTTIPDILMTWRRHKDAITFKSISKSSSINKDNKEDNNFSKWNCFRQSNKLLFQHWRSSSYGEYMNSRSTLIDYIATNYPAKDIKIIRCFSKVISLTSRQTIFSFFMAGLYSAKGHFLEIQSKKSLKFVMAKILWAFREPYNQWFSVRNEKYLF